MPHFSFNLLHDFQSKRDSYGFALRPQYAQRYRDYSSIYQEEEDERSDKWSDFLEQVAGSSQPTSENEHKEILKAEPESNEVREERNPHRLSNGDDSSRRKFSELEEETNAVRVSEGEDSNYRKSAEGNEIVEETMLDRVSKGDDSSDRTTSVGTEIKEGTSPGRVTEGDDLSRRKFSELEETNAVRVSEGEDSNSRKSAEGNEIIEETVVDRVSKGDDSSEGTTSVGTEIKEGTSPGRVTEGDDSSARNFISYSTIGKKSGKELHHSEERKTRKVQRWAEIRPSLTTIEKILSSRLKKGKKMKGGEINGNHDHLPSIEESEPVRDGMNGSRAENALVDEDLPEHFSQWKELETLVQGGVPKDLRGEVWQAFVGVKTRRAESYYEDLLALDASEEQDVPSAAFGKWKKQIEKVISCMRLGLYFDLSPCFG